ARRGAARRGPRQAAHRQGAVALARLRRSARAGEARLPEGARVRSRAHASGRAARALSRARDRAPGAVPVPRPPRRRPAPVRARGYFAAGSPFARLLRRLDRKACEAADLVLLDTAPHALRLAELTGLPTARFGAVPLGDVAAPSERPAFRPQLAGEKLEV